MHLDHARNRWLRKMSGDDMVAHAWATATEIYKLSEANGHTTLDFAKCIPPGQT